MPSLKWNLTLLFKADTDPRSVLIVVFKINPKSILITTLPDKELRTTLSWGTYFNSIPNASQLQASIY